MVRTVTDPETGRRYSVAVQPRHSFGAPGPRTRRNTVAVLPNEYASIELPSEANPNPSPESNLPLRRATIETAPAANTPDKPRKMSKVVRSVKNVTKGYSSVQVKVRNGMRNTDAVQ